MPVSRRIAGFLESASWIRRMFEEGHRLKAERGERNVFDLSLGNPVLEPPAAFKEKLRALAADETPGMHRYMPNAGYPGTRAAIAAHYAAETGLPIEAGDVVMTCGAGGALNVLFRTILDPGDEVIALRPFFVEYRFYVDNHGGRIVIVDTTDREFQLDVDAIERAITDRTRAIVLNSPNNPTGAVYRRADLERLGEVLERAGRTHGGPIYLVSDEPYRRIAYDGVEVPYLFDFHEQGFLVTSHSKDLGLAGERIGFLIAHPAMADKADLLAGAIFANRTLGFVNAPALMQRLVADLQGESVDVGFYRAKRDRLLEALTGAGYEVNVPQGAFYMFPRTPIPDDVAFVRSLQEEGVLVVPGKGFGSPGHVRISYAVEDWVIDGALPGFVRAIERVGRE